MKVLVLVLALIAGCWAKDVIGKDELDVLFSKFFNNTLSDAEKETFEKVIEVSHRPDRRVKFEDDNPTRLVLDCLICRSAFAALFESVYIGHSDQHISNVLTNLCVNLGIESYGVCKGAIELNVPILAYIIRNTPEATPESFCSLLLQTAQYHGICPLTDTRFEWQVDLPEHGEVVEPTHTNEGPLKIILITDAHLDPLYEAYGAAVCGEPTCCRKGQHNADYFVARYEVNDTLIESSLVREGQNVSVNLELVAQSREARMRTQTRIRPRNVEPAGYWGDYRRCDTPLWAFDNVIDEITEKEKDIDLVYYIGDSIDHGVWETSLDLIKTTNQYVIDKIRQGFGEDVPVLMAIGNHEAQPTNQFSPTTITGDKVNTTWLYDSLVEKWGIYLTDEAKAALRERGDYSMLVKPGLRVISLNSNIAYRDNWWLVYDPLDQKNHLDWLIGELHRAEMAGEKVHILSHIPPGLHDLTYTWTREYNRIVNRFSKTIAAEFNGHTHSDEFKIFYNSTDGSPINMAWNAGGTTTYSNYNLNYKVITVNGDDFQLTQMQNYVYNLTEANLNPNRKPHWFLLYDMTQRFQLDDLTPVSMDNLVNRMVTSDYRMLDLYASFFSKLSDARWPFCNEQCKISTVCQTVITVLWERERCTRLEDLYYNRTV